MRYKVPVVFRVMDEIELEADSESEAQVMARELVDESFPEIEEALQTILEDFNSVAECDRVEVEEPELLE